jgi:hypothetical protein
LAEHQEDHDKLAEILDQETQKLMAQNRRAVLTSALFIILVAIYMVWAGGRLRVAFHPEAVADAATGVAQNAIPQAAEGLQLMLEDGAADIAESFGESLLTVLPGYREDLVEDLGGAMDSLSDLLADRLFETLLKTPTQVYFETEEGPDRVLVLDAMLLDLDQRLAIAIEDAAAQEQIAQALLQPKRTNRALRKRAQGRQEDHDRELLLMWLSVIAER